jgi:Cu+-exporting ATPase
LSKVKTIIFDKTGTLTTGKFTIQEYYFADEKTKNESLNIIRLLENKSSHPIATSISQLLNDYSENISLTNIEEIKGKGMQAKLGDETIQLGSTSWLGHYFPDEIKANFSIFLVKNDIPIAALKIRDELKSDAKTVINDLKKMGIRPVILSGDKQKVVEEIANKLGIETFYFEKNPIEKLSIVRAFSKQHDVAMLGDGINDAPSLTAAGVGISFSAASQVAINSAQVVLLNNDKLSSLTDAIQISKMTIQTVKQNLFWAFFYNVIAIPVAAFGFLNPMFGALSMAFSDLMVIGNSIRLKFRKI